MATSPAEELCILTITVFKQGEDEGWTWHTESVAGVTVSRGLDKWTDLDLAVMNFFAAQEYNPDALPPEEQHYSKLIKVHDREYHMREYVHGAPEPYQ